jgi:hypothetical protein
MTPEPGSKLSTPDQGWLPTPYGGQPDEKTRDGPACQWALPPRVSPFDGSA